MEITVNNLNFTERCLRDALSHSPGNENLLFSLFLHYLLNLVKFQQISIFFQNQVRFDYQTFARESEIHYDHGLGLTVFILFYFVCFRFLFQASEPNILSNQRLPSHFCISALFWVLRVLFFLCLVLEAIIFGIERSIWKWQFIWKLCRYAW